MKIKAPGYFYKVSTKVNTFQINREIQRFKF